jgi:hypothetical protein
MVRTDSKSGERQKAVFGGTGWRGEKKSRKTYLFLNITGYRNAKTIIALPRIVPVRISRGREEVAEQTAARVLIGTGSFQAWVKKRQARFNKRVAEG